MMKIKVTNIVWDTDGEIVDLPKEVIIDDIPEEDIRELAKDIGYYDDDVANYLSDRYGWCLETFNMEVIK